MRIGVALELTAFVCALAGSARAARASRASRASDDGKACLEGVVKDCVEIGTAIANEEAPVGDVDELGADCGKTKNEQSCAGWLREQVKAGCRNGKEAACRSLGEGEARRIAEESAPTVEALEARCKKKQQQSCVDLAVRLLKEDPSATQRKRALSLLEQSCKAGVGDGCAELGMLLVFSGKNAEGKRGLKLMKRACDLGSKAGCTFQRTFEPPHPRVMKPGDQTTGIPLLQTDDVGQVMKNLAKVTRLLQKNCELGYTDACAELRAGQDADPANEPAPLSPAELAAKIRKLERQAAAGPAPTKK